MSSISTDLISILMRQERPAKQGRNPKWVGSPDLHNSPNPKPSSCALTLSRHFGFREGRHFGFFREGFFSKSAIFLSYFFKSL